MPRGYVGKFADAPKTKVSRVSGIVVITPFISHDLFNTYINVGKISFTPKISIDIKVVGIRIDSDMNMWISGFLCGKIVQEKVSGQA